MLTDWEKRFVDEYWQTKERYDKLRRMIVKYEAGTLDFKPKCTVGLLREQKDVMSQYLRILEIRAEIEGVDFETFENERDNLVEYLNGFSRAWSLTHDGPRRSET